MILLKKAFGFLMLLLIPVMLDAQQGYEDFYKRSLSVNNAGMYVLGSWAITNMAVGAYGWARNDGSNKYFHQMNLFWNTVNISIAGFALYNNYTTDISLLSNEGMMNQHKMMERLFLINAGLDILYMGGGYYLTHIAKKKTKRKEMFNGYGRSVILQGGFLFVFDLIMYGIQRNNRLEFMRDFNLSYLNNGLVLNYGMNF